MFTVKDALFLNIRLCQKKSLWIRNSHSIEIDSSSTSEAKADPVLLFDVSIVEWEVNRVNWLIMPWRVD